jgi:hypothetical protein
VSERERGRESVRKREREGTGCETMMASEEGEYGAREELDMELKAKAHPV